MMRQVKNFFIGGILAIAFAALVFVFWMRDRYAVPILTYHNISDTHGKFALNNVTPKAFEWQMKFLKKHDYHVISFDDYVQGVKHGFDFARNTVIIHFDDGYEDNYTNAFPILKQYKFPAMVFLVSDSIDTPGFLTWDQVKEMDVHGFKAGAHTRHHLYLPEISSIQARDEIFGSKKIIEERLGKL